MLVSEYLEQVREEMDKSGQPYFESSDLVRRFEIATYSFLEQNIEFMQFNQKAREDLGDLTIPFDISNNVNGLFSFASNFYRLISVEATKSNESNPLIIVQSNDLGKLKKDPFHSPTKDYPKAEFYGKGLLIDPVPDKITGFYLKNPTFGSLDNDNLIEGLPIYIQYHIIKAVELGLMTTTGDERYQLQYYQVEKQ